MMQFINWATQSMCTKEDMPLAEVQKLDLWVHERHQYRVRKLVPSVFQLPKLRILSIASQPGPINVDSFSPSEGCSTIEELALRGEAYALWPILSACKQLRVLSFTHIFVWEPKGTRSEIPKAILQKAESLEELRLTIDLLHANVSWLDESEEVANGEIPLNHWLNRFSQLRKLTVDMEYLFPFSGPTSVSQDYLITRLPISLEELTIDWNNYRLVNLQKKCIRNGKYGIWLSIVKALKMLLREAGPGRKFRNLRHFNAVEILYGSDELHQVMEIGESNGVHVTKGPEYESSSDEESSEDEH